jgi:hypothetical protein
MLLGKMKRISGEWRYFDEKLNIPYPWYTSPCLQWLETIEIRGKSIFEYGVGDSTVWYRTKGALCYGVDNNIEYANKAWAAHAHFFEDYINAINGLVEFDIVVIDGVWRDDCTAKALEHLKPGGYLIIDNWKQASVQEHWPLTEKLIEGMPITVYKEPEHEDWQTAVITKL